MPQPKPSKTARKREQLALQELGVRLIGLTADELCELPIDDRLRDAVLAASTLRAHGALRRQKQLIGKLMREVDAEPIRQALAVRSADDRRRKRVFADAERWRDRILQNGNKAIDAFCEETGTDHASLRELLSNLHTTVDDRSAKTIRRQLFRDVHDTLLARTQDDRIPR